MSRGTPVGRDCDDRPKDYSLRMGGLRMVKISFSTMGLCSSRLLCLREKESEVCPQIDRRKGGCYPHQFMS